ncbi:MULTISPECIES: SMP-30/gluconolactonase/LRE family protein [Bacteria]|uniref:SMP-30/gluconolactonase/LRE family protein n=1 Tax=Bacteria TaxID=2 RepID=UPI003C7D34D4
MNENTAVENRLGRDGVSRRMVVRGAAWSIPVIATAVAVPLASASGEIRIRVTIPGAGGCAAPGTVLADALDIEVADDSGPIAGAAVTLSFASVDGGTLTHGGQTYPGSVVPVTVVTDAAGRATLANVTLLTPTTVTVQATVTMPDGRTATSNAAAYQICAPCAQEAFHANYGDHRDAVVDAEGNLYLSTYAAPNGVVKISPTGQELWYAKGPAWEEGSLGVGFAPDGRLYAARGWPTAGPVIYELDPATGAIVRELIDASWVAPNVSGGLVYPYGITFSPDGSTLYVSSFRDAATGQIIAVDLATGAASTFAGKTNLQSLVDIISDGNGGFYGTHWASAATNGLVHIDPAGNETTIASFPGDGVVNYFTIEDGHAYVGTQGSNHYRVNLATGEKTRLDCLTATYVTQIVRIPGTNDAYVIQWKGPVLRVRNLFV